MNFEDWWNLHKELYIPLNITKNMALTIWDAAINQSVIDAHSKDIVK